MRYSDLEWLPVTTLAELWARDDGMLPKEQLWLLIWKAIWNGDFENKDVRWPRFVRQIIKKLRESPGPWLIYPYTQCA